MRKRQNRYVAPGSDTIDSLLEVADADWDEVLSGGPVGGRGAGPSGFTSRGNEQLTGRATAAAGAGAGASNRQTTASLNNPPGSSRHPPVSAPPSKLAAGLTNLVKQEEGIFFSKKSTAFDMAKEQEDLHSRLSELMPEVKIHLATYKEKVETLSKSWIENQAAAAELSERAGVLQAENTEMQNTLDIKALASGYGPKINNRRRNKKSTGDEMRILQDDLRREFLRDAGKEAVVTDMTGEDEAASAFRFANSLSKLLNKLTPVEGSIKKIESTLGGDVGAYFRFQRWMLLSQVPLFIVGFVLCLIHVINLFDAGRSEEVLHGVGVLPGFMYHSTYTRNEGFAYICAVVVSILFLVISAAIKFTTASREHQDVGFNEGDVSKKHAHAALMAWDNSAASDIEAEYLFGVLELRFKDMCEKLAKKGQNSVSDVLGLYFRRVAGLVLYAYLQFACYVVVSFLSQVRYVPTGTTGTSLRLRQFMGAVLLPSVVSIMNHLLTYALEGLSRFERWESDKTTAVLTVYKMYIMIFLNLLVLATSNGLIVDPYLFAMRDATAIRNNLAPHFIDAYECRMNQASDAFMMNIVSDFAVHFIVDVVATRVFPIISNLSAFNQTKREFTIFHSMASSLYFTGLVAFAIPFCPMILLIAPLIFAIRFRFDVKSALAHLSRPRRSIPVQEMKYLFAVLHFVTVAVFGIVSAYFFLDNHHLPKDCSIQDNNINLCDINVLTNDVCTMDPSSKYYYYFSTSVNCDGGYPYCVCHDELACGPFIHDRTPTKVFAETLDSVPGVSQIWTYFFVESVGAWGVCVVVFLIQAFINNSYHVMYTAKEDKDKKISAHIAELNNTLKMYQKQASQLHLMNRDDTMNDNRRRPI